MNYNEKLTLLIPLYGREYCTERQLKFFKNIGLKYNVFIADGSKTSQENIVKKYIRNVNISYEYFGYDSSINKYIKKMYNAFDYIDTPFIIQVDNDDYICPDGLSYGINFLYNNKEYSSYRGGIVNNFKSNMYKEPSIENNNFIERIYCSINRKNSEYHNIMYSNLIKIYYELLYKSNTDDLQLVLTYNRLWNSVFGKTMKANDLSFYYHVDGQSLVQNNILTKYVRWVSSHKFNKSMAFLVSVFGNIISLMSKKDLLLCKNEFSQELCKNIYIRNNINNYVQHINEHVENSLQFDDLIKEVFSNNFDVIKNFNSNITKNNIILDEVKYIDKITHIRKFV